MMPVAAPSRSPVAEAAAMAGAMLDAVYARLRVANWAAPPHADGALIRPLLALAGMRARGDGPTPQFADAMAAIQLAHEASLLHDDVIDGARERRARPTLMARSGVAAALVEGDHLLVTAYRLAARTGATAFADAFARAVERTVAGEKMHGRMAGAVPWHAYRRTIAWKSGELLGCALATAPLLAGSTLAPRWYVIGRRVGALYQMIDDLLDYVPLAGTGKPPFADFRQRRWTWPLAHLRDVSFAEDAAVVAHRLAKREPPDAAPLDRCLAVIRGEADALRTVLAANLPGDAIAAALVSSWVDRATTVVGRALDDADRDVLNELERRVPDVDGVDAFFRRNSRSFSFAARLFPEPFRTRVAHIYAFCRVTDDLADDDDGGRPAARAARLDAWERLAARAYAGDRTGIVVLERAMRDAADAGVPFDWVRELIEGMRMDVRGTAFDTMSELRVYSHRVAGVVGQWLTVLSGRSDPWLLDRADALGHAMQLTNIIRDVGEDLDRGRVYLPDDVLHQHGLRRTDLPFIAVLPAMPRAWRHMLEDLMARADRDYNDALAATPDLPAFFGRPVVVAAHIYRGIHDAVRRNDYDNFRYRARVGGAARVRLAIRALSRTVLVGP